jgi:hypothetical protein
MGCAPCSPDPPHGAAYAHVLGYLREREAQLAREQMRLRHLEEQQTQLALEVRGVG